jgi:hypothetical protein
VRVTSTSLGRVRGTFVVPAVSSDNLQLARTELWVDGRRIASASGTRVSFDSRKVANGSRRLVVRAVDRAGNVRDGAAMTATVRN